MPLTRPASAIVGRRPLVPRASSRRVSPGVVLTAYMDVVVVVASGGPLTSEFPLSGVAQRHIPRNTVVRLAAKTVLLPRVTATVALPLEPRPLRARLVFQHLVPPPPITRLAWTLYYNFPKDISLGKK